MDISTFYKITGTESHFEFDRYLREIIKRPEERNSFYENLMEKGADLSKDIFRSYFELYAAERKTNAQDFTPDNLAVLMAKIAAMSIKKDDCAIYDAAAGTGALIVAQWEAMERDRGITAYAVEISDSAIPYLIHNLNIRRMNAVIMQGDTLERRAKQVYRLIDGTINILPHTKQTEEEYKIREWLEADQRYFECEEVKRNYDN